MESGTKHSLSFLKGNGEMVGLTRGYDWASSVLGAPDAWSLSLRTTLANMLYSGFPAFLFWGSELTCFYNDAYRPSLGADGKHPAVGKPARKVWHDIWDFIGPLIDSVLTTGEAVKFEDQLLPIYRNGRTEDVYWTFSYSLVVNDDGNPGGVLVTCMETTDAVLSRKKLEESEGRFQNLVRDASVAVIMLLGEDMKVAIVNDAYGRLIGRRVDELIGKELFSVIPETEAFFRPIIEGVRTTGEEIYLYDTPYTVHSPAGTVEGFLNLIYQPYREADGMITGVTVLCQDVTKQVRAQQGQAASEAHLRLLRNTVPAMIFYLDAEQRYQSYNQTFMKWFDVDETEIIGKTVLEFIGPDAYKSTLPHLEKAYAGEQARYEMWAPSRMGAGRWLSISYTPHIAAGGEVIGVIVHAGDITKTKQSEVELRESEATLRNAIELAELGTWKIDIPGKTVTYSDRLQAWLGLEAAAWDISASPRIRPEDRDRVAASMYKALQKGSDGRFDEVYTITHTQTDQPRIIHASGQVIFDAAGNPLFMSGTAQDVTMQRELQLALENQVQERTEELASTNEELQATIEELADTNTALVHSNEELAQYAYVASHDLQEPLRKIRVFTGMLSSAAELLPGSRVTLDKISGSAERMSLLIQDLLSFSRLLKSESMIRPVPLREVVAAVWDDFELIVSEKSATIEIGALPLIQAVNLQMNQLFYNLINNALKFSAAGRPPHLRISARELSGAEVTHFIPKPLAFSKYYQITVSDNGIGFETQYREQIFDVFQRLHGRDIYPGSGIGLAVCRRIVMNHHGYLFAASEVGVGSTFNIILPDLQHDNTSHSDEPRMEFN